MEVGQNIKTGEKNLDFNKDRYPLERSLCQKKIYFKNFKLLPRNYRTKDFTGSNFALQRQFLKQFSHHFIQINPTSYNVEMLPSKERSNTSLEYESSFLWISGAERSLLMS